MADEDKYCPLGKRRKQIISLVIRRKEIFRSDSPAKKVWDVDKDEIQNTDSEPEINVCREPHVTINASTSEDDDKSRMIKSSRKIRVLSDIIIKKPLYQISPRNSTYIPDHQAPLPVLAAPAVASAPCNLPESQPGTEHVSPSDQRAPSPALAPAPVEASLSAPCYQPESQPATDQVSPSDQRAPSPALAPAPVEASLSAPCYQPESQPATDHVSPSDQRAPSPALAPAPVEASLSAPCYQPESQPATDHVSPSDQRAPSPALAPAPVEASLSAPCYQPESQPATDQVSPSDQRAPSPALAPAPVEASLSAPCYQPESQPATDHVSPSDQRAPSPALAPAPVEASLSAPCYQPESQPATDHVSPSDQRAPSPPLAPAPVEASSSASCYQPESQPATEYVSPSDQLASSPALTPAPVEASSSAPYYQPESQPATDHVSPSDQRAPSPAPAPAPVEASASASCYQPESQPATEYVSPSDQLASSPALTPAPVEASSSAPYYQPESQPATDHVSPSDQRAPSPAPAPAPVEASASASCYQPESQPATEYVSPSDQRAPSPARTPAPVEASSSAPYYQPESQPATDHVLKGLTHNIISDLKQTSSQKRKRRRTKLNKAFIDFVSDTEKHDFSSGSSDLWTGNDEFSSSDDSGKFNKTKKTKNKKLQKNKTDKNPAAIEVKKKRVNKTKLRKVLKDSGKSYATRDGISKTDKEMKENPCNTEKCPRKCYEISEERRRSLHTHFWNLDTLRRRDWILRCAQAVQIKRRKRSATDNNRRQTTYEYTINQGEGHTQVCQKFLLNTLCISQKYLLYTIKNSHENMAQCDRRRSNVPESYSEETKQYVRTYITSLPAIPSHYNRKRSNKTYLPQEFKNVSNLYRLYSEHCKSMQHEDSPDPKYQIVSERLFRNIFCEYNISFHVPKKDKCVQCTNNENNQDKVCNEDVKNHIGEKIASYKRFQFHQNLRSQYNDTVVCSFDLQKVLNTPHGESMLLYYSRKYAVYNLTFYESVTQNVFCYTWGETDGKRGSNEIATALTKYLENVDQRGIKNIILYCDSCAGQNKNKNVLAAINNFLRVSKHVEVVQINYLLPGHTYMPVDSVHAVIEREVKRLIVWSPSQWATYFESARKQPRPYTVITLEHTDFLNFDDIAAQIFTKSTLKNIKFKDIRIATMKKKATNRIDIKYSMKEHAECHEVKLCDNTDTTRKGKGTGKGRKKENLNQTIAHEGSLTTNRIRKLYNSELPISDAKYKDLITLCEKGVIPKRFHKEYRQLPTHSSVKDRLAETDDEEDREDYE